MRSAPSPMSARGGRSAALPAARGVGAPTAPIRSLPPRPRPLADVPAHPSFAHSPPPLWIPTTGAAGEAERPLDDHVWSWEGHAPPLVPAPLPLPLVLRLEETTEFRVQVDEPPAPPGQQKRPDYYANVGDAIRTLREDIPQLFVKDLNYEIYREDIVFRDPQLSFQGIKNYSLIFWSLRFHGRLFFSKIYVDVLRIWQPEDHQIKMRWRIVGVPRVWWRTDGTIDGVSTYKLDNDGRIYEHAVDNVQLRDPPISNPLLYGLNYVLAPRLHGQPGQMPVPNFTNGGEERAVVPVPVTEHALN